MDHLFSVPSGGELTLMSEANARRFPSSRNATIAPLLFTRQPPLPTIAKHVI